MLSALCTGQMRCLVLSLNTVLGYHVVFSASVCHLSLFLPVGSLVGSLVCLNSTNDAVTCLTTDISLISDWARENPVAVSASERQCFHLSSCSNLPDDYLILSIPLLHILGVSFSHKKLKVVVDSEII